MTPNPSLLFLGKKEDAHCQRALDFCQNKFDPMVAYFGEWGEKLPEALHDWQGDYIISYLSRWVIPPWLLARARKAAINFHPASPHYPGIGCNNFALYEDATEYGATCHHMAEKVDTGAIIAVRRFAVYPHDTVESLLTRTYDVQLCLFYEVVDELMQTGTLVANGEKWTRKPFSRREFNALRKISPDMSKDEIARRVRATSYGKWQPWLALQGFVFELNPAVSSSS